MDSRVLCWLSMREMSKLMRLRHDLSGRGAQLMRRTTVAVFVTLVIVATVCAVAAPVASAKLTPFERQIASLVNAQRRAHGLPVLHPQPNLTQAARLHSAAMARLPFFSHVSPGGSTPSQRCIASGYTQSGCSRWMIGETIAWGTGSLASPNSIVRGWMKSAPHRQILLTAAFRDLGVGIANGIYRARGCMLDDVTYCTIDVGTRAN
jgi:uncharacterized protein YkwD